jgi:FHS family glucose/mannose:H+ symporter-like MFS transporter
MWLLLPFGELDPILKKESKVFTKTGEKVKRKKYAAKQLPIIIAGAFFFFMYVGTEMVLPNYLPTILSITTDLSASSLAMSITVFWAAMTIGRMSMTFIIDRIGYHKLFVICCIGQFFSLLLFANTSSVTMSFIAIFLTGLLMGGIFSIGLLIINETASGLIEWTTSLLVAMGGLGGALLPKVIGELIDRYDITVTLWTIVVFAFILVFLMATIYHFRHRGKELFAPHVAEK